MCGIGGVWGARRLDKPEELARLFSRELAHRGPDGEGFLSIPVHGGGPVSSSSAAEVAAAGPVAGMLVHRRLSIIDLTTGNQPMTLAGTGLWIVFNGEIYNYRELRAELTGLGARFQTVSDTEVILAAYRQWGTKGLSRLNGIFALAIFDSDRRELALARDPVGVKPLYWAQASGCVAFASEVRTLIAAGLASREISHPAIAQYLFYRFVPSPGTLWKDVRKVSPGHILRFGPDGRILEDCDFASPAPVSRMVRVDEIAESFIAAVARQMVADVPVGAYLSGGLDSSLIVAAMRKTGMVPKTFGIGFADSPGTVDEQGPASEAARILETTHESISVKSMSYFADFPRVVLQVEEPLAEAGMLLLSTIAGAAARSLKVVLTGQGADEPIGGYPRHHAVRLAVALSSLPGARAGAGIGTRSRAEKTARFFQVLRARGVAQAAAPFSAWSPEDCGSLVRGVGAEGGRAAILGGAEVWWRRSEGMDPLARILYVDVRTSLADDLLLMGDKTAMAHGLEARVPFVDLEYLRLLESLPGSHRLSPWHRRKWIQHALGRQVLPAPLQARLRGSRNPFRKKLAFEVPVDAWLRGSLGARLVDILAGAGSVLPSFVDRGFLLSTSRRYLEHRGQSYRSVLGLYVLELWLRATVAEVPLERLPAA